MNTSPQTPHHRSRLGWLLVFALVVSAAFLFQQVLLGRPLVRDDAYLFVYPQFRVLADALRAGHLYLWDSQQWCGLPALATGQSGGLYPLHLVLFRVLPWMAAVHLCYWLHLALAAVAMAWVARNLRMNWRAAAVGGVLYACSGYSAAHLVHYNFIAAAAHLALVGAARGGSGAGVLGEPPADLPDGDGGGAAVAAGGRMVAGRG